MSQEEILRVEDLRTYFFLRHSVVKAVNGVSFSIGRGEIVGLLGESGSGKSVTALSIMRLVRNPPGSIVGGRVCFLGEDLLLKCEKDLRRLRGRRIAMIFQDPVNYLDPVFKVKDAISEALIPSKGLKSWQAVVEAHQLLQTLKVPSPEDMLEAYPFQLSGGMCQRVMIAIAIANRPDLLIADEATSALDATVQASVLSTLEEMRDRLGMAVLLTTHNVRIVRRFCSRTMVMYGGRIVETGETDHVLENPCHPYTIGLLGCIPSQENLGKPLAYIPGELSPSLGNSATGCAYYPRCGRAKRVCQYETPSLREVEAGHLGACHFQKGIHDH